MKHSFIFKRTALCAASLALVACGGGGGDSAFPEDPVFNQTELTVSASVLIGGASTDDFPGSIAYEGQNLLYAIQNTILRAGPNDQNFTIDTQLNKADFNAALPPTPTGTNGVDQSVQIVGFTVVNGQRNYCLNIMGTSTRSPESYAVFGSTTVDLGSDLPAAQAQCVGVAVDADGNRFIATTLTQPTITGQTAELGSEAIYRAPAGTTNFAQYWTGMGAYAATDDMGVPLKEDPNDAGSADIVRNLKVGAIKADGGALYWTGTYVSGYNGPETDSALGVANFSELFEASSALATAGGTEVSVTPADGRDVVLKANKIDVVGNNQIYLIADAEVPGTGFSGVYSISRSQSGRPINLLDNGSECNLTFGINTSTAGIFSCYTTSNVIDTRLGL